MCPRRCWTFRNKTHSVNPLVLTPKLGQQGPWAPLGANRPWIRSQDSAPTTVALFWKAQHSAPEKRSYKNFKPAQWVEGCGCNQQNNILSKLSPGHSLPPSLQLDHPGPAPSRTAGGQHLTHAGPSSHTMHWASHTLLPSTRVHIHTDTQTYVKLKQVSENNI